MSRRGLLSLSLPFTSALLLIWACSDNNNNHIDKDITSCEGCHLDQAALKELAAVDTTAPPSGGG